MPNVESSVPALFFQPPFLPAYRVVSPLVGLMSIMDAVRALDAACKTEQCGMKWSTAVARGSWVLGISTPRPSWYAILLVVANCELLNTRNYRRNIDFGLFFNRKHVVRKVSVDSQVIERLYNHSFPYFIQVLKGWHLSETLNWIGK